MNEKLGYQSHLGVDHWDRNPVIAPEEPALGAELAEFLYDDLFLFDSLEVLEIQNFQKCWSSVCVRWNGAEAHYSLQFGHT